MDWLILPPFFTVHYPLKNKKKNLFPVEGKKDMYYIQLPGRISYNKESTFHGNHTTCCTLVKPSTPIKCKRTGLLIRDRYGGPMN